MATPLDSLLRLLASPPSDSLTASVLNKLHENPELANEADEQGYTLLHAATSYGHLDVMRSLVENFDVDVDGGDADGDPPLFYVEKVEPAKVLVEELDADVHFVNEEGENVLDRLGEDAEIEPGVLTYLRGKMGIEETNGVNGDSDIPGLANLPPNVRVQIGTMIGPEGEADPEIKRRIEELAAREDLQTEEGQAELRRLVEEIVGGLRQDTTEERDATRQRV